MLEKLFARIKNYWLILLVIMLSIAVCFTIIKYQIPKFVDIRKEFESAQKKLQLVKFTNNDIADLKAQNKDLKKRLDIVKLPYKNEMRNGINYYFIGQHAVDNFVFITEVLPHPLQDKNTYFEIPLDIKARGKFANIVKFIMAVEQDMPNTCELRTLVIKPEDTHSTEKQQTSDQEKSNSLNTDLIIARDQKPNVEATFCLVTYMIKSPEIITIAQLPPMGRFDIFAPTIDVSKIFLEQTLPKQTLPDSGKTDGTQQNSPVINSSDPVNTHNKTNTHPSDNTTNVTVPANEKDTKETNEMPNIIDKSETYSTK
ncbi:MAG: type 4a pilus biogenesis protein PilO [Bacillota bacterium]